MEKFKLYKHINNKDIAFMPMDLEKENQEGLTFYGKWYNIVHIPFFIDYDTITVKTNDLPNWKEFNDNV
jgi:hypothetical protein